MLANPSRDNVAVSDGCLLHCGFRDALSEVLHGCVEVEVGGMHCTVGFLAGVAH